MSYPTYRPALRVVNAGGGVTLGPLALYQPNSQGIILSSVRVEYVPELLGPWMNLAYSQRLRLLGYRPKIDLDFAMLQADGASGAALMYQFYTAAFTSDTFAPLQFNLYSVGSTVWRGVFPTTPWNPRPMGSKERIGFEFSVSLEARDLISAPGDWTAGTW